MKDLIMRKLLLLSLLLVSSVELSARIIESNTIRTVLNIVREFKDRRVLVAFDLDETLIVPDNDNCRGGDIWLQERVNNAVRQGVSVGLAWDLMLPMYFEIQKDPNFEVRLIEGYETFNVIQQVQQEADKAIGLTARSFPIEDDTIRLLENTGLSFVKSGWFSVFGDHNEVFMFDGVPGGFKHGIFFAGKGDKGKSLMIFLERCKYKPDVVVFADDKLKNLQAVEKAVEAAGIEFVGILYTRMDKEKEEFKLHPDLT
jgi:hypothetical protein